MADHSIDFGWGRDPLNIQLGNMGFDFNSQAIMHLEADMAAALRLHMRHMITDSAWRDAVKKITKAVSKQIRGPVAREHSSPRQVVQPIRDAVNPSLKEV